jgi:hypothetical protein
MTDEQRSLEIAPNPEAQFMVGLFYATGLGGVKEDQGKVRLYRRGDADVRPYYTIRLPRSRDIDLLRWLWDTGIGRE